jgi:hypothetical protein
VTLPPRECFKCGEIIDAEADDAMADDDAAAAACGVCFDAGLLCALYMPARAWAADDAS